VIASWTGLLLCLSYRLVNSDVLINSEPFTLMSRTMVCNNGPYTEVLLKFVRYSGLSFVRVLMHTFEPLCVLSSDIPGFDPATLNRMILYYRLMTKWSGLGDSTELSRKRLSYSASV
jgi:GTP:adenosylcobinamide-phosphate guanylyltransferase